MNLKDLIPKHKSDFSSIQQLETLTDEDFEKIGLEVLAWMQDINWPIAAAIRDLVVSKQNVMTGHILTVLKGEDEWWKYGLITNVLPFISKNNLEHLLPQLGKMYDAPTPAEIKEEVHDEVVNFLHDNAHRDNRQEISNLIFSLWEEEKLPDIGGLLLKDGKFYKNIRFLQDKTNKHLIYNYLVDLEKYNQAFGYIYIVQKIECKNYTIYCGDSSHGSIGYILVLNAQGEFEFLLFDEINPIEQIELKEGVIYASNNCGEQFILSVDHPENYKIV